MAGATGRFAGVLPIVLVILVVTLALTLYNRGHSWTFIGNSNEAGCLQRYSEEDRLLRSFLLRGTSESTSELDLESKRHIKELQERLNAQRILLNDLEKRNRYLMHQLQANERDLEHSPEAGIPLVSPDVVRTMNIRQKNEFELIPFISFTKDRLYQLEPGLTHRPEDAPKGDRKKEVQEVLDSAVKLLNEGSDETGFSIDHFVDGLMRTDSTMGTQYELFFKSPVDQEYRHLEIFRPFGSLQSVRKQVIFKQKEWMNIIIPLKGRLETFKQFLETFTETCIQNDQLIFLTIVYFGEEGLQDTQNVLNEKMMAHNFTDYKFIAKNEEFSRGQGLHAGAAAWNGGNVLMFFCDVDIYFDRYFINRCRMNAEPGRKVYYPIVFSLYNPEMVYRGKTIPPLSEQRVIGKNNGYWRDFGFGMTCIYRSDFLYMKGFDMNIVGWGLEDVKLFRKIVASNFEVVRAPDRGIFHLYHPKSCDLDLSHDQYIMCLGSKAVSEASPHQLGLLAFQHLEKEYTKYHKN